MWNTKDDLVGRRVTIYDSMGDDETATVLAVSTRTANIRVITDDGDVLVGGQWDDAS